jgi:hypothetical protein
MFNYKTATNKEIFEYMDKNLQADKKFEEFVEIAGIEHYVKVSDYIDPTEEIYGAGGWIFNDEGTLGFCSRFTNTKGNLKFIDFNDEIEDNGYGNTRTNAELVLSKIRRYEFDYSELPMIKTYYRQREMTAKEEYELKKGKITEEDVSTEMAVYLFEMFLGCEDLLIHTVKSTNEMYFVEILPKRAEEDQNSKEDVEVQEEKKEA